MTFYDIFNGDADGICALHQLRLAEPRESVLITGVKRDIALLERVPAMAGDELTVLDISMHQNGAALKRLLEAGAACRYFDHHFPGEIPQHPRLQAFIETSPDICTSLLVDRYLSGAQRIWAVVAAFGDNLRDAARRCAEPLHLSEQQFGQLRELGECINYNAYGETTEDLHFHPAELYRKLSAYRDPFSFIARENIFEILKKGFAEDMERAKDVVPESQNDSGAVYILPEAGWSRRVSGVFGNHLARSHPQRAHAVLVRRKGGGYTVSVRAPVNNPTGADELCREFETGGGRKAAAGINHLPEAQLQNFLERFFLAFRR